MVDDPLECSLPEMPSSWQHWYGHGHNDLHIITFDAEGIGSHLLVCNCGPALPVCPAMPDPPPTDWSLSV